MSFAASVKEELCSTQVSKCCAMAELYGMLLFCNTFTAENVRVVTESSGVVKRISAHCVRLCSFEPEISKSVGKKDITYIINITNKEYIKRLLLTLGIHMDKHYLSIEHHILENDCCRGAFLRGAFLCGGTITSPDRAYHFEICTPRNHLSKDLCTMLKEYELSPKLVLRKQNYVVYFKDSESIEDLLNIIGAKKSEFELMNVKIYKDFRNNANRISNCEAANISKTVNAALAQVYAIGQLKKSGKFEELSEDLKKIAALRVKHRSLSLNELSKLCNPPLTRSTLNNKLKKIENLALKAGKEKTKK